MVVVQRIGMEHVHVVRNMTAHLIPRLLRFVELTLLCEKVMSAIHNMWMSRLTGSRVFVVSSENRKRWCTRINMLYAPRSGLTGQGDQ